MGLLQVFILSLTLSDRSSFRGRTSANFLISRQLPLVFRRRAQSSNLRYGRFSPDSSDLAKEIIDHLQAKDDLFIPLYEEVFRTVLERYHADFRKEGAHSYDYKINSGRMI